MGNWFCRAKKLRILMLGLDGAGKTTMLYKIKYGGIVSTIPTIGVNVETVHVEGIDVVCWDIALRDKARALLQHYFADAQGFVYMIDSCDRERLHEALEELVSEVFYNDKVNDSVVMLVANKQDKEGAMSAQEIEDALLQFPVTRTHNTVFMVPCNALDEKQVTEIFSHFIHQILLSEAGRTKRGFISLKDQPSQMRGNESDTEMTLKFMLRDPIGYFKTFFE